MGFALPDSAAAVCTPDTTVTNPTTNVGTSSSVSTRVVGGDGIEITVGTLGGDQSFGGNCVLDVVGTVNSVISIRNPLDAITSFSSGIVLDDASTGNTILVQGVNNSNNSTDARLGANGIALQDGAGSNHVILGPYSILSRGNIVLGDGDDTLEISWRAPIQNALFDGGGDTDTLAFFGTENFGNGRVIDISRFSNFEHLIVRGSNRWELISPGTTSFQTITVAGGPQSLIGVWEASETVTISDGSISFTTDGSRLTARDLNVSGRGGLSLVNATSVTITGRTTLSGSGNIGVGSSFETDELVVTGGNFRVSTPGSEAVAALTMVSGGRLSVGDQGVFTANGPASISDGGIVTTSDGGVFHATESLRILADGILLGSFNAPGVIRGRVENSAGIANGASYIFTRFGVPGFRPGTLSIVGAYVQGPGGEFHAGIRPVSEGASDLVMVEGTTSLAGTLTIVNFGGAFAVGDQIRLLATDSPISGTFDTTSIAGNPIGNVTGLILKTNADGSPNESGGTNIDILFVRSGGLSGDGLPENLGAIAQQFATVLPPGALVARDDLTTVALLASITPTSLQQLSPEMYDSFTTFSFDMARQYGGLIDRRVRTLRCAAARGPQGAFCGAGQTLFASDRQDPTLITGGQIADAGAGLAPGAAGTTSPRGFSPNTHPYGWSVWASGLGAGLWKDQTSSNIGYSGWTTGGVIGVDLALSQRLIVGVLTGASRTDIGFDGVSGDGDMESVTVGVYAAWYGSRWFANTAFFYSKNWVDADRDLLAAGSTANGKTEGDQYAAHATLGYGFKLRRLSVELSGGIDWAQLRQDSFTETGGGLLALTVNSRTDDSLRLRAGVRIARAWKVRPNLIIAPNLRVGYARELFDTTRPVTASFAGVGGAFTVTGDSGGRDIVTFGGGIQADFSQGVTLYLSHSGEWAQDRQAHSFTGGLKVRW